MVTTEEIRGLDMSEMTTTGWGPAISEGAKRPDPTFVVCCRTLLDFHCSLHVLLTLLAAHYTYAPSCSHAARCTLS